MASRTTANEDAPTVRINPEDLTVRVDTSGGPGGQHANRAKSRVTVELDLRTATSFDEPTLARLREAFGNVVRSSSSASRRQGDNRRAAQERLVARVQAALEEQAPRAKTRPTRSSVERRLQEKRRRSTVKRYRTDVEE